MPTVVKVISGYLEVDAGGTGGGQPPGFWGGVPPNYIDIGGPGPQPPGGGTPSHPWVPPGGSPSHPWVPPGGSPSHPWVPPPGSPSHPIPPNIWGGAPIGGGGQPPGFWGGITPHPDQGLPGQQPPGGGGGQPPGFWGGTPPIYIDIGPPGEQPKPPEDQSKIEWHTGWTQTEGWVTVGIVKTDKPIPTPSGDR